MLKIAWSPVYTHPLPAGHRFPMEKYNLLPEQLLYEGTIRSENFFEPGPLPENCIINTHAPDYWHRLKHLQLTPYEVRRTGFPLSEALVRREIIIAHGTVLAADYALQHGIAMNIAGGTHHAFSNRGEGFCLLNDMAIGANYLLEKGLAAKIMIVDLDVHQGNGTAELFRNNATVFTFSMHGEKNYPLHKEHSDLDIGLPDATGDHQYLQILRENLPRLIEQQEPDFIFYQSGVDVLASDALGRLSLSLEGCRTRDWLVLELCHRHRIPVVVSMGGGYSKKLSLIIEAHANTYRLAQEIFF